MNNNFSSEFITESWSFLSPLQLTLQLSQSINKWTSPFLILWQNLLFSATFVLYVLAKKRSIKSNRFKCMKTLIKNLHPNFVNLKFMSDFFTRTCFLEKNKYVLLVTHLVNIVQINQHHNNKSKLVLLIQTKYKVYQRSLLPSHFAWFSPRHAFVLHFSSSSLSSSTCILNFVSFLALLFKMLGTFKPV